MKRYRWKGTITVFLSLLSVFLLSLLCTMVESARVQGSLVRAAVVTDLGIFSVHGEYERTLLDNYRFFAVDGAYGNGEFDAANMGRHLQKYLEKNISIKGVHLFPMEIVEAKVNGYTLATDADGGAFYQQIVAGMKDTLALEAAKDYVSEAAKAQKQDTEGKLYEDWDKRTEAELEAERSANEEDTQVEGSDSAEEGETEEESNEEDKQEVTPKENPLEIIKKVKKMGILGLVVKEPQKLSNKSVAADVLPSGRSLNTGSLPVKEEAAGIVEDGLFQEYLLKNFQCMTDGEDGCALDYELEYLLCGKENDIENLKSVVNRILLAREGSNFLYILGNARMQSQAQTLALALTGAFAIPGLVTVTKSAIMLAWAYGESLFDVRTLLAGGRIPVLKNETTWKLSLENLGKVTELLTECDKGGGTGQDYRDYLRGLFYVGDRAEYPMRALDLIEVSMREEMAAFRIDNCVVQTEASVKWRIKPVFLHVPAAFLGTKMEDFTYETKGRFCY